MGSKALKYSAVLIGTYLVVYYGTRSGDVIAKGGGAGVGLIKAFQGR